MSVTIGVTPGIPALVPHRTPTNTPVLHVPIDRPHRPMDGNAHPLWAIVAAVFSFLVQQVPTPVGIGQGALTSSSPR